MKLAICEDDGKDLIAFRYLVDEYARLYKKNIVISEFSSGTQLLESYKKGIFDVVFLDIYMGEISGISTAKAIRRLDEDVKIIFTTSSTEHFSDGFDVEAIHYLIKPLDKNKIFKAMHRLRDIFLKDEVYLVFFMGNQELKIPQSSIVYIETVRNGITVHCKKNEFKVRCSLASAIKQLKPNFLQCHRYFVINLDEVAGLETECFIMSDRTEIAIRRSGRKELKNLYRRYLINNLRSRI